MSEFRLHAPYQPTGDQPEAIAELVNGIRAGDHEQTLLGVTVREKPLPLRMSSHKSTSQRSFWHIIKF